MTTNRTTGHLSVSIVAGHITASKQPITPDIGQMFTMGNDLYFHIRPEIAAQWIEALAPIANEGINE